MVAPSQILITALICSEKDSKVPNETLMEDAGGTAQGFQSSLAIKEQGFS